MSLPKFVLLISTCVCLGARAEAQGFSIDWFTVDGGGGTSGNGQYTISGTAGQPDAGSAAGGVYALNGGFWGGAIAVQVAGAPTLRISNSAPGFITISWTPNTPGFVLQSTEDAALAPGSWSNVPSGGTNPVNVEAPASRRFYRLAHP